MEQEKHTYALIREGREYCVFNGSVNLSWIIERTSIFMGFWESESQMPIFIWITLVRVINNLILKSYIDY